MKLHLKGAAKCLIFSLGTAALTGCAVYEPYPSAYGAYDPYPYSYPYPYGQPVYAGVPYYVGPPVSLGLWFDARDGGGHRGHFGGHHRGGHSSGWGGRHR